MWALFSRTVVTTELVILLVCFFCLLVIGAQYSSVLIILFVMALVFPVLFYHHSWVCGSGSTSLSNRCRSTTLKAATKQKQSGAGAGRMIFGSYTLLASSAVYYSKPCIWVILPASRLPREASFLVQRTVKLNLVAAARIEQVQEHN